MSMRTHMRALAHSLMHQAGVTGENRIRGKALRSYFARTWRDWLAQAGKKENRKRMRKEARITRRA